MIYTVDVHRRLNKPANECDVAFIRPFDDEPNVEAEVPTGRLAYLPPTENNVAYYRGTFASEGEAIAAVKQDFPLARISRDD